jgi:hypothetical protein
MRIFEIPIPLGDTGRSVTAHDGASFVLDDGRTLWAAPPAEDATPEQIAAAALPLLAAPPDRPDRAAIARKAYDDATEQLLCDRAGAWGYASMERAAGYAASTVPQFAAEAAALIAHRDAVWLAGFAILAAVEAGERPIPTLAAYLAELPAAPARPVA